MVASCNKWSKKDCFYSKPGHYNDYTITHTSFCFASMPVMSQLWIYGWVNTLYAKHSSIIRLSEYFVCQTQFYYTAEWIFCIPNIVLLYVWVNTLYAKHSSIIRLSEYFVCQTQFYYWHHATSKQHFPILSSFMTYHRVCS